MKIPPDQNPRVKGAHPKPPSAAQRKRSASRSEECEGDEVRKFTELAKSLPDVWQEKIEDIKRRIQAGTYEVSAESVAQSIVDLHAELSSDGKKASQTAASRPRSDSAV